MSEISDEMNSPFLTDYSTPTRQNESLDDVNSITGEDEYHTDTSDDISQAQKTSSDLNPYIPYLLTSM